MRVGYRAVVIVLPLGLACLGPCIARAAPPAVDPNELARCGQIAAADERLACYDALSRSRSPETPPAPSVSPASPAADESRVAEKSPAADKLPAANDSSPQAAPAAGGVNAFGLSRHEAPPPAPPDVVRAQVAAVRTDRLGKVHVRLDNGQVWSFTAADALLRAGEAVTIRRASLGSFLMTTPSHHTYRVQRTE
jgi:hypothetical protein